MPTPSLFNTVLFLLAILHVQALATMERETPTSLLHRNPSLVKPGTLMGRSYTVHNVNCRDVQPEVRTLTTLVDREAVDLPTGRFPDVHHILNPQDPPSKRGISEIDLNHLLPLSNDAMPSPPQILGEDHSVLGNLEPRGDTLVHEPEPNRKALNMLSDESPAPPPRMPTSTPTPQSTLPSTAKANTSITLIPRSSETTGAVPTTNPMRLNKTNLKTNKHKKTKATLRKEELTPKRDGQGSKHGGVMKH
ncbi:hypothetical protein JAAARDRAFT_33381 [Jaapia argillacea MUCL 33604]|uniref:Uncharacterized protein n=1 Tax=Jaapia argillacea MUCL 33604 TaxID=933084 RepID=A0A067Q0Z5_9AGAM|nr:hypothetical protein JAAARDRAFT_33381 [Jaapia argillacea MUCL 33604]